MGTGSTQTSQLKPQEEAELNELARVVLADTEKAWGSYFKQHGQNYTPTTLVLYNGGTSTACGMGQSAMGPFYCPGDQKVYLDLDFYRDMQTKLNSASDAAFAYVIAHEVGHHVQNLLGILPKVHRMQQQVGKKEANALSVKLELQADCYAGVWMHWASTTRDPATGAYYLNTPTADEVLGALQTAQAIGDDRLQARYQGTSNPETWTHGSANQRAAWLQRGLDSGEIATCDTWSAPRV